EVRADPNVCFVRTPGAGTQLEAACRKAGVLADAFQFSGDYYALPNLVTLLARPSNLDLLMEIMEYPLPQRKPACAGTAPSPRGGGRRHFGTRGRRNKESPRPTPCRSRGPHASGMAAVTRCIS